MTGVIEAHTEALNENTKAIIAHTAALSGGKVASAPTEAKKGPGRPKTVKLADVKAIAERVREEKGRPAAVSLIKKHGADSLSELDESKYAQFVAAAEVLLNAEAEAEAETGGEADL